MLLLAGLAVGVGATPASAHASLESSDPAAGAVVPRTPPAVELQFTEAVSVGLGGVRVIAASGDAVATREPTTVPGRPELVRQPLPRLATGTYVVTWRVLSADSHPVRGAFTFSVGEVTEGGGGARITRQFLAGGTTDRTVDVGYAVVRFAVFTALALLIGGLVVAAWVWRRAVAVPRVRRVLWIAWAVLLVGTVLAFCLQGAYAGGLGLGGAFRPAVWGDLVGTRLGLVLLARLVLIVALVPVLRAAARDPRPRWWLPLAALLVVGIAATPGLGGHASVGTLSALAVVVDTLHVLAMATWVGGLAVLILLLTAHAEDEGLEGLPTWSRLATLAVLVVVFTGVVRGLRELGGISTVFDTAFGILLAVKVGLVLLALLVATVARDAVHRRWALDPEEVELADRERAALLAEGHEVPTRRGHSLVPDDDGIDTLRYVLPERTARTRLLRAVAVEVALLIAVLGVTAVLVNTAPAGTTRNGSYAATLEVGDLLADVSVSPARVGPNEVHLTVLDPAGGPAQILNVTVEFSLPEEGIAPIDVPMRNAGPAHYLSAGFTPPVPGDWQMTLKVLVDPITEVSTAATVPIR